MRCRAEGVGYGEVFCGAPSVDVVPYLCELGVDDLVAIFAIAVVQSTHGGGRSLGFARVASGDDPARRQWA